MALYSLVIEHGGKFYSVQVIAPSAGLALKKYFKDRYPKSGRSFFGETAPMIAAKDIIHITPMDTLINMWMCQAGQGGSYVSVICSRTVIRPSG
jgi:hypothetical protein